MITAILILFRMLYDMFQTERNPTMNPTIKRRPDTVRDIVYDVSWGSCVTIAGASLHSYKQVVEAMKPFNTGRQLVLHALTYDICRRKPDMAAAFWNEYDKVLQSV